MTPVILGAALALFALDASSTSSTSTGDKPPVVQTSKVDPSQDPDRVICRKEQITGSRFEKRICMTREQWHEEERRTEEFERKLNQRSDPALKGGMGGG